MKPRYQVRCAMRCLDNKGRPRSGDQWVHLRGLTYWVCGPCAERLGQVYGIPSTAQVRRATREREARQQLPLDIEQLRLQAEEGLEEA